MQVVARPALFSFAATFLLLVLTLRTVALGLQLARQPPPAKIFMDTLDHTNMIEFNDLSDIFDFASYYQEDEPVLNSTQPPSPASTPPPLLPDYPESPLTTISDPAEPPSPSLTEEEDAHYNNIIYHAVDSPVLPTTGQDHIAEMSLTFVDIPPPFASLSPTITNSSIPPATPTPSSPSASASASPPVLKRRRSLSMESSEPQPGPSSSPWTRERTPREPDPNLHPAKRPRLSVSGEPAFQLDVQVPAFVPTAPSGPQEASTSREGFVLCFEPSMERTRQRVDYSACKCSSKTSKPARHWKTACPYNLARHQNRVSCELCGETFSRHDNLDRHMEDYH